MPDAIVFTLPQAPDPEHLEAHWWLVGDGRILDSGTGSEWVSLAEGGGSGQRKRVALAPAASVRIEIADRAPEMSDRQAATAARLAAIEASLGEPEALHAVSEARGDKVVSALVDNGMMLAWLDWARGVGADPHHVVPVAALLPIGDEWTAATFGSERVLGRRGIVIPFEPELAGHIVGDIDPLELGQDAVDSAIVSAAEAPPLDLRSGKMARKRRLVVDRRRMRELALIAALIPLIVLIYAVAGIVKLNAATARLNEESLAVAERALGRPVDLATVESELSRRVGGVGLGGVMAPLTGLYSALQPEESVSSTGLSYSSDGTLSATLAAPTVDAINRVLIAVQRDGYRITAVPRQAPDGRSMVDVTVRSGP